MDITQGSQEAVVAPVAPPEAAGSLADGEAVSAPSRPHIGRKAGTPNVSTQRVRQAIALVAEEGASRIWPWLEEIDDPAKRLDLYLRLIEYHIPKLARTEVTGADGGPQQHTYRWLDDRDGDVIDVTPGTDQH